MDSLSRKLNDSRIGCYAGGVIINHLLYADDLVLIAPSVKALQKLLHICEQYACSNDIIYNTDKTKCMVCWPKYDISGAQPFTLQGERLELVREFKYLGVILCSDMADDAEMKKRTRGLYATGNTIISNFRKCVDSCKVAMFRTYCYAVYCCALWSSYRVGSLAKLKVAHNDVFRTLMNVPRMASASTLFVNHATKNLDAIMRTAMHSLMSRLLRSSNTLVRAAVRSEVRVHSRIWQRWGVALGVQWDTIMVY